MANIDGDGGSNQLRGTSADDRIRGFLGDDSLIDELGGNDILIGGAGSDSMAGGEGDDIYVFAPGFGVDAGFVGLTQRDTVSEGIGEGFDTIAFVGGIAPSDIKMTTWGNRLILRYNDDPLSEIEVGLQMIRGGPGNSPQTGVDVGQRIEQITFEDGTVWDLTNGLTIFGIEDYLQIDGSPLGDTLKGSDSPDQIQGHDGDDVIDGNGGLDGLEGGRGDDVYRYGPDDLTYSGAPVSGESIHERLGEGTDTVQFTGGITQADLKIWTKNGGAQAGYLFIQIGDDPRSRIDVYGNAVFDANFNIIGRDVGQRIERITFDGGPDIDLTSGLFLLGDEADETISGFGGDDTIDGRGGGDQLFGEGGNDRLIGGTGDDDIDGGRGIDTAVYSGARSDYAISDFGGVYTVTDFRTVTLDNDGFDTLVDVEILEFSDMTVLLGPDAPHDLDTEQGEDLLFQRLNGNHFVVNGETGVFSIGVGRGTDTVNDLDDFNGDGIAEILFERATGEHYVYDQVSNAVSGLGRTTETFIATLDVEGDGSAEILFQRANGNHYAVDTTSTFVVGYGRAGETVLGVGDFDGDGGEDLLMQRADGSFVWIDGETRSANGLNRDTADMFLGIGDFND
ncbi:MAG: calcium-binding protein, partial [Pseudomonadota bacterium]